MSTAKSRPADAPNPTRQMLDELDALMERMLTLPVNEPEEERTKEKRPERPAMAATLTMVETPPPPPSAPPAPETKILVGRVTTPSYTAPEEPAAADAGSFPVGPDYRGEATGYSQAPPLPDAPAYVDAPAYADAPAYTDAAPYLEECALPAQSPWRPSESNQAETTPSEQALPISEHHIPDRRSLGSVLLQPLLWINGVYDRWTSWLGPLGRLLRSPRGRAVIGFVGLTLIGLAIAWSVRDWFGWWW
jgi:hypothetical protein